MILEPVKVTGSGRPVLYPGEVERALLDRADLAFMGRGGLPGQLDEAYKAGYIILTNQRLVWMDAAAAPAAGRSCCLSAHSVTSLAKRPAGLLSSKSKLELTIRTAQDGRPVAAAAAAAGSGQLTIKCKDAIDAFASILADVIRSPMPAPPQSAHSAGRPDNLISPSRLAELPQAAPAPVQQPAQPDEQLVKQIMEMGFARGQAVSAVLATRSEGVQQALDWVLAFGNQAPAPAAALPADAAGPMPWQHAGSTADLPALPSSTGTAALGAGAGPNGAGAAAPAVGGGGGVVGVSGIVRREQHKTSETGKSLDVAFQDLSALMAMAQAMVQLAERFRGVRAAAQGGGNGGGGAGEEDVMDAETQLELISMGIASPVTKESSGARYHTQLSRQLADFLQQPLAKHGGMLTLPDVYCLFNRARGTELVSPDDLLTAAGLFPSIGVPLRLRRFASGVMVVQSGLHSEEQMAQRIAQLVEGEGCGPGLSAAELAAALGISVTIAREHLLNAEGQGLLCRDDSHEGLRFYRNFFKLVELPAAMPAC